jgi:Yip1-like protein
MATNPTDGSRSSLVDRVKNILMQPKAEWPVIDAEPTTIADIYRNYVVILAAIPAICTAIGLFLMGNGFFHFSASFILGQAILSYVMTLVGVYIFALILEALAPSFGGTKDRVKAFKLAAYSWTAAWVAGVVMIIPLLGILVLVAAIYGFYLLYLGVPVLMKVPEDKSVVYTVAAIVAMIIIYFLISIVTSRIMWTMMPPVNTISLTYPT